MQMSFKTVPGSAWKQNTSPETTDKVGLGRVVHENKKFTYLLLSQAVLNNIALILSPSASWWEETGQNPGDPRASEDCR